ncbi:serine hydrolase [Mycolicibacterium duvalii]|uniref:Serine hydrolase n=1 Tax=Mycolicibacterium duvalii TaxID=39688 RepID=A0A7I7JVV4_9MYCO|nr:serine hydrolase domain-containing protein [Mycolicibacterium duvalii]MCV7369956.1 beta-lactamase family protein [Mycolicibacterium duvalii]PEG38357.1 serine hydrolase [Mycolicibacterium duvalii]BBX15943.1 serine hydrolase [Mycolicibacterium duvalii]
MSALDVLADWPVPTVAAAVVGRDGTIAHHGDTTHAFALASVTKLLVARAVQVAVEEGAVDLDSEAGPPGSTVQHLLAHAAGYEMTSGKVIAAPGTRRIYSNHGFTVLAQTLEQATDIPFADYLRDAVFQPLGMSDTAFDGGAEAAGFGGTSTVDDLAVFARDLLVPATVSQQMHDRAISVAFEGLDGVLPGFGVQRPNDWGLGFEIRDGKSPHWTGAANSPRTFGHFGQSGTFLWVDPEAELALVVLTDRQFGDWAHEVMPALSDEVLREFGSD